MSSLQYVINNRKTRIISILRNVIVKKWYKPRKKENENLDYYFSSQWQLMGRKLVKHKLARCSIIILSILYTGVFFAPFIAPYSLFSYNPDTINCPPTTVHIWDRETGKITFPFVYGLKTERDSETYRKLFVDDVTQKYPIRFFADGEPYKLLGLFQTKRHLFGIERGDTLAGLFLFGTDAMGRDLFSRILLGSQVSLTIPFIATFINFVLGLSIGSISGYFGGIVDRIIQRLIEVIMSFPTIPLWMALAAAIPARVSVVMMYLLITIIISFITWTKLARTVRSKFISLRNNEYVLAAKVAGVTDFKIITRHLIPGFMSYLIVDLTLSIPGMILGETSMSFLGLGIRSPATSWGVLLQEAQNIQNVALYPWKLIPLLFVIIAVLAFNFLGDGIRDAADPYK